MHFLKSGPFQVIWTKAADRRGFYTRKFPIVILQKEAAE